MIVEQNNPNPATGGGEAAAGTRRTARACGEKAIMMEPFSGARLYALPVAGFEDPVANILPRVVAAGTSAGT